MIDQKILTRPDVEALLGVCSKTVYRRVRDGSFPPPDRLLQVRPGYQPMQLWLRETVEAWLRQREAPAA